MSKFFDSEQVQDTLNDIEELQTIIQKGMMENNFVEFWQEEERLEDLEELFEKQQLMYVRMKLSDDPEAKAIVDKMRAYNVSEETRIEMISIVKEETEGCWDAND